MSAPPPAVPSLELATAEAGRFVRALFDPADHVLFHPIRDRAWGTGAGGEKLWFTIADDELDDALAWVWQRNNQERGGQCAFFGANPRRAPGQTGNAGVAAARAYFADFDATTLNDAVARIRAAGMPVPSVVVVSGGGVHAYWLLHEPEDHLGEWRHRQKWLAAALQSDGAVVDPNRLMRLPGFPNRKHKYSATTPVARLVVCDAGRRYSWRDLQPAADHEPLRAVELTDEELAALPPVPVGSMSALSRRFVRDGWVAKSGRRMTAFVVAVDMAARGWTLAAATAAIVTRLRALGLPDDDLADMPRQVANAFKQPRRRIVDPEELRPAARVEHIPTPPTATLDAIRDDVAHQLRRVLEERPALAVLRHGTGGAKTTTAVELVAATPGRVTWNVASHAAALAVVAMHHEAGHTDAAAMPPRDETTCRCWTRADVDRVAAAHGVRPGPSMEQALAVGAPMAACVRCPLWPSFKRPANAPAPDPDLAAFAPVDEGTLVDAFVDPWADHGATEVEVGGGCEYFRRVDAAARARIVVQCQARTERRPADVAGEGWERSTVVTDENAMAVLRPRRVVLVEELLSVASVLSAAAANRSHRGRTHGSHAAWRRASVLPLWLEAMAKLATDLAALAERHAAAEQRAVVDVPHMPVDLDRPGHTSVMEAVAREELPRGFRADALELVWLVASGADHQAFVYVEPDAGGAWHGSFHRSWDLDLPPGVAHIVLDATAHVPALHRVRPDALILDPPGAAAMVHDARQVWLEVNNRTHPLVVLELLERLVDAMGWLRAAALIPKRHRRVLFPQTRPRRGIPMDLPADVDAIAAWNAGRRELADDPARRMAVARDCAARVERLRARMARDANGNTLVDHHRGTRAKGSNDFMADACDGLAVVGHVRVPTTEVASYLMSTGQADAAAVDGGWADVEGELPHVDGGTRTVRWRGYTDERWAEAARALNRADLVQTVARARANLPGDAGGVPVVLVAAEPTGLPLADLPAAVPAGVAAVVEAVRRLVAGGDGGPRLSKMPPAGGAGESGQPCTGHTRRGKVGKVGATPEAADGGGESRQPCTGHTPSPFLYTVGGILPGVPTAVVVAAVDAPRRSVERWLADAVAMGLLARHGSARATRYGLPGPPAEVAGPPPAAPPLAAATGVVEAGPVGQVLERRVGGGALATAPPTPVPPAPYPRDANAPESVTSVEVEVGKMSTVVDIFPPPPPPTAPTQNVDQGQHFAGPPPAPTPVPTPASTAGIVGPTSNPPPRPTARLTGPRATVVAELRAKLRAAAWDARVAHMDGVDHEAEAAAIMATGTRAPP